MTNAKAFTLIEVLVVLLIIGILAVVALPVYTSMTDGARVNEMMNQLAQSIKLAKSVAKRERRAVTVCASIDGSSCMAAAAGAWANGWIVSVNPVGNRNNLRAVHAATAGVVVNDNAAVAARGSLTLQPSGLLGADGVRAIEFSRGASRGCMQLSAAGSLSLSKAACT